MPNFTNPFSQTVPDRKMTMPELVRAIRMNTAAELDAASLYEAHAEATDNPLAKQVFLDIANEERVHVGEFIELLKILLPDEEGWLQDGFNEVREIAEHLEQEDASIPATEHKTECGNENETHPCIPSIGSLR